MTDNTDHKGRKAREQILAYQFNLKLKIEGYGTQDAKDRKSLARTAQAERTERRRLIEMRRRPSYVSAEAGRPFEPDVRLIRAKDRPDTREPEISEPAARLSFKQMRALSNEFPDTPAEAKEFQQRKRRQRRALNQKKRDAKKK